ncbi:MAG: acetate kinase [Oscillospiraceae bacterium]|jgi:acetate kinase|nr:acetate kinase [Oscillospiraceae bacterium]
MKVLVINCGSSSVKYQVFDMEDERVIAKGICEKIAVSEGSGHIKHTPQNGKPTFNEDIALPNHTVAIKKVLSLLGSEEYGVVANLSEIGAVGHRVLNGGPKYATSVVVTQEVIEDIKRFIPLGPLHNPHNLSGINACFEAMPGVAQVATFDTSFHATMPEHAFTYAIPYEYTQKHNIRRYGFHGTSHRYVSERAIEKLGGKPNSRVVTLHLGNGSSLAAIRDGKVIDTSMGLTPLEGVPMGTRSGSIDPAVVEFIADKEGFSVGEVLKVLNNESGIYGVSGVSSDFRDVEFVAGDQRSPNPDLAEQAADPELARRSKLALEIFYYNVAKIAASYIAVLGGADAIVFTAGLGENSPETRERIIAYLAAFGVTVNVEENAKRGEIEITGADSKVRVFVIPTNEELVIARDTNALV